VSTGFGRVVKKSLLASMLLATVPLQSQTPETTMDRQTRQAHSEGFFDYALHKLNAREHDYGTSLETKRNVIASSTVDDLYFWSNLLALLLLSGVSGALWFHWRSAGKREMIDAMLIAQLWNARISDRIEIGQRTAKYNELIETHNAATEATLATRTSTAEDQRAPEQTIAKGVRKLAEKSKPSDEASDGAQLRLAIEPPQEGGTSDLQQAKLLLERRVEALQNSIANLKQRLNQATAQVEQERRRNASLKGA
jgi:hypothetical protein